MNDKIFNYFATCPIGCEAFLADELKGLGLRNVVADRNGVAFSGPFEDGAKACLWSRIASRILLLLAEVKAATATQLYTNCKDIAWEEHISSLSTFAIEGIGANRQIRHSGFLALKVKDALVDRMRQKAGRRPNVDRKSPDIRILARLDGDKLTLALDMAGEALHRRGWRRKGGDAPLKETLASTILIAAGYTGDCPLIDPMCGSGTLLVEAAEIALGIAPGHRRHFGFESWPAVAKTDKRAFETARRESSRPKKDEVPSIIGGDMDGQMLRQARYNIEKAGFDDRIRLARQDATKAVFTKSGGLLVTNPPYGERLQAKDEEPEALYRRLGKSWMDMGDGRLGVFCANQAFRRSFALKPEKIFDLFNGPLKGRLFLYSVGAVWRKD